MFKRVLVASDLTEQCTIALKLAGRLARDARASITVTHVVAMPAVLKTWEGSAFRADLARYREVLERQIEAGRVRLERQAKTAGLDLATTKFIVRAGLPATVIANLAEDLDADLIIVARGGRGLGNVAEQTVRLAGRAVLVAPVPRKPRIKKQPPAASRRPGGRIRA